MYVDIQQQDSSLAKIRRSLYLIVSISLLTHTISITYSMMAFKQESVGFISIIVSSFVCFFLSSSHLTIYGISILGCIYMTMLMPYYTRAQLFYVVALSGAFNFPLWKMIHSIGSIFHCLPGRIHASLVFGIALIVLCKFFPLAIQNIKAFFQAADSSPLTSPLKIIQDTFETFNILTLILTGVCILGLFILRSRLQKIPLIALLVLLGVGINWTHYFLSFKDLCHTTGVDCTFYILKTSNLVQPELKTVIQIIPASLIMTVILIYEQFLYLEEFERRGKRFGGGGNLGEIKTQSKVLAVANLISGCLGGLPICINMFATYENFAFNKKYGFRGTKLVGLFQIPVSYALYSVLSFFFQMIPLFILFTVVATPMIYFLRNMLKIYYRQLPMIIIIATLNVITHPIIALVFASVVSIYDIAELLKPAPAEMLLQGFPDTDRKSNAYLKVIEEQKHPQNQLMNQFVSKVIQIDDDLPMELQNDNQCVIYRLTGSISYLNYFEHSNQLVRILQKYSKNENFVLVISFRYSQIIDEQSLEEMALLTKRVREQGVKIVYTGLHIQLMHKMQNIEYFKQMLQQDEKCMYCLHME